MTTPEETCAVCQNKLPSSAHWFALGYAAGALSVLRSAALQLCAVHQSLVDHYMDEFRIRRENGPQRSEPFHVLGRNPVQQ